MSHEQLLLVALVGMFLLVVAVWAIPGPCACEKCGFHVNERRMEAVRQAELAHEYEHKGPAWNGLSPDRYPCRDSECPRNPRRSE